MGIAIDDRPDGITLVALDGRLDIQGASAVDLQVSVIAGSRPTVVIDLANVTFLASMGVRTLVTATRTVTRRGGRIRLCAPAEGVRQVLATSGVDQMVPIDATLDASVAALAV